MVKPTKIKLKNTLIRWTKLEYLPIYIINIPVFLFWLYFAIKSRALFFFSTANPKHETGGFFGDSKAELMNGLPESTTPITLRFSGMTSFNQVMKKVEEKALKYPVVGKPDVGERGHLVEKLSDDMQLRDYCASIGDRPFLIQEYIDFPLELGILHYRFPGEKKGHISSVCEKQPLTVEGDGRSTLEQLILKKERSRLQYFALKEKWNDKFQEVIAAGRTIVLEEIGNHSRGSTFLNRNDWIDLELTEIFDRINGHLEDVHFVRYDLRCESIELLRQGKAFKILEVNGASGEPAHVYHPGLSVGFFYGEMWRHWRILYEISKAVHKKNGIPYLSAIKGMKKLTHYFKMK